MACKLRCRFCRYFFAAFFPPQSIHALAERDQRPTAATLEGAAAGGIGLGKGVPLGEGQASRRPRLKVMLFAHACPRVRGFFLENPFLQRDTRSNLFQIRRQYYRTAYLIRKFLSILVSAECHLLLLWGLCRRLLASLLWSAAILLSLAMNRDCQ